jgi:small subunit ribosomal protein S9
MTIKTDSKTTKKLPLKSKKSVPLVKPDHYFEAIGSRKTAQARVRLFTKIKTIVINNKDYQEYFRHPHHQLIIKAPLDLMKVADKLGATVKVKGGGLIAQAEAIRHAIARALLFFNPDYKKRLRNAGYLTRDSRAVERKKYGLKKARRAPQWAKR